MTKHKCKLTLEIFLLVGSVFAFGYIMKEAQSGMPEIINEKNKIGWKYLLFFVVKNIVELVFNEKSLVSALDGEDLQKGTYTCIKGKDGSICQEYPSSECNAKCEEQCLPTGRDQVSQCKLGTCFDSDSGICQERSTKGECEKNGGQWFDDVAGNVVECQKACCVVGEEVVPLITSRECAKIGETRGISTNYRPEIKNELSCLALGRTKVEGACVFDNAEEKKCRFLAKGECLGNNGQFFEGILCTHPDLNIGYEKQASAKCIEGKDEIYWFDSDGNRENIYDANKARSWNNGEILAKEDSCKLGENSDPLNNQKTCGNCNRFLGSVCGEKTNSEKLSDNSIDVVCRDTRCVDREGKARENGESWCEYQGAIGIDKGSSGLDRSVDTPGSSHFRATCIDGEVQINPCEEHRNEICIEKRNKRSDGEEISNSACIINLWQLCLKYNADVKGKKAELEASTEERNEKCLKNPMCNLKEVNIADSFKFDICVPKYSPGFDLKKNAEGGELSCAFATQKCTVISVKKIDGWKVKVNEGCLKQGFAEQMNDLCMSLGDCGASVNYNGDLTLNYKVKNSPKLKEKYIGGIKKYSEPVEGQYADINITQYIDAVGGLEKFGGSLSNPAPELQFASTVAGATGLVLAYGSHLALLPGAGLAGLGGLAGVLAGAAIGFAVTALLIQYTGIGAGLDPMITWGLIASGTVAGALIGGYLTGATASVASALGAGAGAGAGGATAAAAVASVLAVIGVVIILVIIIIVVVLVALGIGKTKKVNVTFTCQPWQPVLGGSKCRECGKDGYPCSKYSCQSLGQSCEFINEDSADAVCVDVNPGDASAPVIGPWKESLTSGLKYEEISDNGFKISSEQEDKCIGSYQNIFFGISLNEPGYCRYNFKHTNSFEEMDNDEGGDFNERNLFLYNHTQFFTIPDLTSLGLPGYDPNRKMDFNFNVRCIDSRGNGENSKEYVINLCVKPGEDKTPPIVTGREPFSENAAFNATKINAKIFINEPAECKWSLDSNKEYDIMENNMECLSDVEDRNSLFGWECESTLEMDKTEKTFYIRCKDQPWNAGINETKRNIMLTPYEFKIKRTATPLIINSIKPNNEAFVFGIEPATVILEVMTSGGIDGRATCYLFGKEMGETFRTTHKQVLNRIFAGSYEFPITCKDSVGNTAEATSRFTANLDSDPPIVTRVYNQEGSLVVVTNEESECAFVREGKKGEECNFEFKNGTLMSGTSDKVHTTSFDNGNYYIKCKDKWGYIPGECSVIVNGGEY